MIGKIDDENVCGGFSKNLFWDAEAADLDFERNRPYVVQRILERGTVEDVRSAFRIYGVPGVVSTAKVLRTLEPRALSFIACIANEPRENFRCYTQRQYSQALWIYATRRPDESDVLWGV